MPLSQLHRHSILNLVSFRVMPTQPTSGQSDLQSTRGERRSTLIGQYGDISCVCIAFKSAPIPVQTIKLLFKYKKWSHHCDRKLHKSGFVRRHGLTHSPQNRDSVYLPMMRSSSDCHIKMPMICAWLLSFYLTMSES